MKNNKLLAFLAIIFAMFMGAAVLPVLVRTGVETISPLSFSFFRYFFAGIFLLPITYKLFKENSPKEIIKVLPFFATIGINAFLFSIGIQYTTVVSSQLIYTLSPAVVAILSLLLLKNKISKQKLIGILVAMSGISILLLSSYKSGDISSLGTIKGNLIILLAMISYSFYLIFSKKLSIKFKPTYIASLSAIATTILFFPLATYDIVINDALNNISLKSFLSLLLISFLTAIVTFLIQYSVKILSPTTTSLAILLAPIFALLSGVLIYHETISFSLIASLILVMSGMIISIKTNQTKNK